MQHFSLLVCSVNESDFFFCKILQIVSASHHVFNINVLVTFSCSLPSTSSTLCTADSTTTAALKGKKNESFQAFKPKNMCPNVNTS